MEEPAALPQEEHEPRPGVPSKRSLRCTACGYGVFRSAPPERCPMCQITGAWVRTPLRSPTALATS
jgi:rubrerythrin